MRFSKLRFGDVERCSKLSVALSFAQFAPRIAPRATARLRLASRDSRDPIELRSTETIPLTQVAFAKASSCLRETETALPHRPPTRAKAAVTTDGRHSDSARS